MTNKVIARDSEIAFTYKSGSGFPNISFVEGTRSLGVISELITYIPYNLPGFRSLIRSRVSATTQLIGDVIQADGGGCHYRMELYSLGDPSKTIVWSAEVKGDWAGYNLNLPPDPSLHNFAETDNLAAEKLQKKVLSIQRQFQSGVFLGELAETIRLIRNPLGAMFEDTLQYCDRIRRRARIYKRLKDRKKLVTDSWLQYSYGIAPLVSDIQGAAEAASKIIAYRLPSQVATGSASDSSYTSHYTKFQDWGPMLLTGQFVESSSVSIRYKACVNVGNNTQQDDLESLGITWGNFAPTLWEIIPYSFLVDYFTNVGSVIDSLAVNESRIGWCEKGISLESQSECSRLECTLAPQHFFPGSLVIESQGNLPVVRRRHFERNAVGLPSPTLRFKLPFSSPIKDANLAALAIANASALASLR
jgi:hypothetical protein